MTVLLSAAIILVGLAISVISASVWLAYRTIGKRKELLNVQMGELHI